MFIEILLVVIILLLTRIMLLLDACYDRNNHKWRQ